MKSRAKIPISVSVLTLNAEHFLPATLASVAEFDDVYICDGNSTDATLAIAKERGIRIERQFDTDAENKTVTNFGEIFNRAMSFAKYDWYLRLDVDEEITPELAEELRSIAANSEPQPHVYKIPRRYVWKSQVINDSITYPNNQIRFFRRSAVKGFEKITHERLAPKEGEVVAVTKHPMLVNVLNTYFSEAKIVRALEWDRREFENYTLYDCAYSLVHTLYVFALFGTRALRVYFYSSGPRLPFAYDWWRYRYMARAQWLATKIVARKLFAGTLKLK